jgi:hypothetical protein
MIAYGSIFMLNAVGCHHRLWSVDLRGVVPPRAVAVAIHELLLIDRRLNALGFGELGGVAR